MRKKREREEKDNLEKTKKIDMMFSSFSVVKVSRFILPFSVRTYITTITKQQQLVFRHRSFFSFCASGFFPYQQLKKNVKDRHITFFF
jgi:hypothetical protein